MLLTSLAPDAPSGAGRSSQIDLVKGALWTHRLRGGPLRLSCTAGSVWITREGDPSDVVLRAGSSYGGAGRGLLVVEALEPAQIAVAAGEGWAQVRAALRGARDRWRVLLALAAVYVIWGSTYLGLRIGLETLPPFLLGGVRFVLAGALLYGVLRLRGAPAPTWREWGAAARVGALLIVLGNGMVAVAQQWVSSGVAAVVVSTMPLWMALITSVRGLAAGRAGEAPAGGQVSRGEWVGLLLGFAGVALLRAGDALHAEHAGALLIVLAPISWAIGSVYSRSLPLPQGPMAIAAEMLTGGAGMLAVSVLLGERLAAAPSLRSLLSLGYLTVFGSLIAFSAYMYLLKHTRPAIATSYAYVNPIIAIGLGVWLGGETTSPATWAAAAIIGAGLVILSRARPAR